MSDAADRGRPAQRTERSEEQEPVRRGAIPRPVRVSSDGDTILDADGFSLTCEGLIRDDATAEAIVAALNGRAAQPEGSLQEHAALFWFVVGGAHAIARTWGHGCSASHGGKRAEAVLERALARAREGGDLSAEWLTALRRDLEHALGLFPLPGSSGLRAAGTSLIAEGVVISELYLVLQHIRGILQEPEPTAGDLEPSEEHQAAALLGLLEHQRECTAPDLLHRAQVLAVIHWRRAYADQEA